MAWPSTYVEKVAEVADMELFGYDVLVMTVDGLIAAKRAAGRPKDLLDLGFLAALKQRQR